MTYKEFLELRKKEKAREVKNGPLGQQYIDGKPVTEDEYFDKLSEVVEAHPIRRIGT